MAVQHWRPYLLGSKFLVRTDHRSLKHLLSQPITSPAQQNWVAKLFGFNMEIEYKVGPQVARNQGKSGKGRKSQPTVCPGGWKAVSQRANLYSCIIFLDPSAVRGISRYSYRWSLRSLEDVQKAVGKCLLARDVQGGSRICCLLLDLSEKQV